MKINVTKNFYLAMAAISTGRMLRNNARGRAVNAERTPEIQFQNDLQGVFGELAAVLYAEHKGIPARHTVLGTEPDGGCDLILDLEEGPRAYDVKGLFMVGKRYILVNQRTHFKYAGKIEGYIPILGNVGADCFFVGRTIPHDRINDWFIKDFGYNDPAYMVTVEQLIADYFDESIDEIKVALFSTLAKLTNLKTLRMVPGMTHIPCEYATDSRMKYGQIIQVAKDITKELVK